MLRKHPATLTEPSCRGEFCPAGCPLEMSVLTSVIAVSAAGVLMGLRFKAPALIAATALLFVGTLAWNSLGFPYVTVINFLILVFVLACAYMVGLSLSVRFGRDGDRA